MASFLSRNTILYSIQHGRTKYGARNIGEDICRKNENFEKLFFLKIKKESIQCQVLEKLDVLL
jgi:hypothetical protein